MHVYGPRPGADKLLVTNFDVNRKPRSLWPFVASFKIISLNSDFIYFDHLLQIKEKKKPLSTLNLDTFFNYFIHVNSSGASADKSLGLKILTSTESSYHFDHLLQVSKKSLWILILYTFFYVFPHVYSPVAGADNPLWTKSWCQQKSLVTLPICCKFQKISLKSAFIHIF